MADTSTSFLQGSFRWFWLVTGWFQLALGGLSWFSCGFRSFLVLMRTEHHNVGMDLICSFLCNKLLHISLFVQNFNHFDSPHLETVE